MRGFAFQTTRSALAEPGASGRGGELVRGLGCRSVFLVTPGRKRDLAKISALRFDDQPDRRAAHGGLRVAHLGTSSVRYEIGLIGDGEKNASAQGHFVHVCVDRSTSRPVPQRLRSALTPDRVEPGEMLRWI